MAVLAWLGLKLLGIGKIVGSFLKSLPWWVYAIVAAVLLLLLGCHLHSNAEKRLAADNWNAGWTASDTKWRAESAKAKAAQIAANARPAILSQHVAEESDARAPVDYAKGRAASDAYAAAHLVRGPTAGPPGSASGRSDLPVADRPAAQHDGPGADADMVAVARADFDVLTANSTRLAKVHQDAEQLIATGVAVAEGPPTSNPIEPQGGN